MTGLDHNLGCFERNLLVDRDDFCGRRSHSLFEPPIRRVCAEVRPPRGTRLLRGYRKLPCGDRRDVEIAGGLGEADLHERLISEDVLAADEPEKSVGVEQ